VAEIARRVGADESSLYRLLRFLASEGVFEEVEPKRFALACKSRFPVTASDRAYYLRM
jgi:DNA-binding IclR family transcriptional regulator